MTADGPGTGVVDPQPTDLLRPIFANRTALVLEDEKMFFEPILRLLSHYGFARVDHYVVGEAARDAALARPYDVLILDRMNSGMDGLDVLRTVRGAEGPSRHTPALLVTSLNQEWQRIDGLLNGADDYVAKPVSELELVARIASQLRRAGQQGKEGAPTREQAIFESGPLVVKEVAKTVTFAGHGIELTAQSFAVLAQLMRERGQPITKTMLFQRCWPNWTILPEGWENTIYKAIDRLRTALHPFEKKLPAEYRPIIMNLRGQGYVLRDLSAVSSSPE